MMKVITYAILAMGAESFVQISRLSPSRTIDVRIMSSNPNFDMSSAKRSIKANESPLVDRALDSALDFLQDAEGKGEDAEDDEYDLFDIYEESPDIEIPYDLISELEAKEAAALANKLPSGAAVNKLAVNAAVAKWRKHENDCGSAEVQVAIANEKIKYMTKHLLANKFDVSSRRGLNALVQHRRKFLNYLYEHDRQKAVKMIQELGIRFRPPGRMWDKDAKYGSFKNTKSKWEKLRAIARAERDSRVKTDA